MKHICTTSTNTPEPYFICGTCQMKSYNSNDVKNCFCGKCNSFTTDPYNLPKEDNFLIKQHIPAFADGVDRAYFSFKDVEDLKEVPFVKTALELLQGAKLSINNQDSPLLLVEYKGSSQWFVLGKIKSLRGNKLELPTTLIANN